MPRDTNVPQINPKDKRLLQIVQQLQELATERLSPGATFEERQRARADVMADAMWMAEEADLQALVTNSDYVEVDGKSYRGLSQASSATYHGLWGTHVVSESLFRDTSVRGGPTIKPIELLAGIIHGMLPDFARVAGRLLAHMTTREVTATLQDMGYRPPSRAFIEKRVGEMACEVHDDIAALEAAAPPLPPEGAKVASISCGIDRLAVRMHETLPEADDAAGVPTPKKMPLRRHGKPYERTPPPPATLNWRMAWVGSLTMYDADGEPLRTIRYAANPDADPNVLADRIVADVRSILAQHPDIPVVNLQDAAKDLRTLPAKLLDLPANSSFYDRVDIHHLLGYLDEVVRTCQPPGDPNRMKIWYRQELMHDDNAIDRIFVNLRRAAENIPLTNPEGRAATAKALRYIKDRRPSMRYAHLAAANLPVGSGATESTCALMQLRIKHPGMSWEPDGLRGISALRTLVLSERWAPAWEVYAAKHRREVLAA